MDYIILPSAYLLSVIIVNRFYKMFNTRAKSNFTRLVLSIFGIKLTFFKPAPLITPSISDTAGFVNLYTIRSFAAYTAIYGYIKTE